ncbi:MAG: SMI1/KNR4 family protein [Acidobacteria bacterium]|nr:SMI1/KNR4 family protein [Acidobacteriota bacterium]
MNPERLNELLHRYQTTRPASPEEIAAFEREAGVTLPSDYREFLRFTDGGEGFIGPNSYAMLWRIGDLLRFNREYQVHEYAPGLLLFGSSGGGEAFAFDQRSGVQKPVVSIPFVGMDLSDALPLAETFEGFLEHLAHQ